MEKALSQLKQLRKGNFRELNPTCSKGWPADPSEYELLEDCGRGVSATVHRAVCKADGEVVAVKKMNLERVSMTLDEIIHEAQTMRCYQHPNVLPLLTSFVQGQDLWMVTPFMSGGSILHIMKYQYPDGLDEGVIATIMRYVLMGLEYVHKNGGIHRDVKAGNILIDRDGTVRIGDFGVAATIEREGSWGNDKCSRTTFVGTPCWMAPEVMEQTQQYNSSADIWSFGITMLELANGHAPFAKFPPLKVLLMTLQNPPPQLDDKQGRKHFSKSMRNLVARCLQKDPSLRPSATELLQDKFFKQARDEVYLRNNLVTGLPALGERVQQIRVGKAATTAAENDKQLERSQEEYVKGVSSWNFDLASLKAQAALEPDDGPAMPTILECAELGDGEGVEQMFRRSTEDAAEQPAATLHKATAAAELGAAEQQPTALQQQQQQQQQQKLQQHLQQPLEAQPMAVHGQQQQNRRAASAFTGSSAMAAAAAAASDTTHLVGGSSLQNHYSEPAMHTVSAALSAPHSLTDKSSALMSAAPLGATSNLQAAGGSSGGSSFCLSPYDGSPPISRESSSQGPLSAMMTADGVPIKAGKSKGRHGRFQVYEHGEEPPPMSPPANKGMQEGLAGSFSRTSDARLSDSAAETPRYRPTLAPSEAAELTAAAAAATAAAGTTGGGVPAAGGTSIPAGGTGALTPLGGAGGSSGTPPPSLPGALAAAAAAPSVGALPPLAPANTAALPPGVTSSGGSAMISAGAAVVPSSTGGGVLPPAAVLPAVSGEDSAAAAETKRRGRFKIIEEDGPGRLTPGRTPSSSDLVMAKLLGKGAGAASGVVSELLRLHEQSVSHSAALARLIEGVRASSNSSSVGNVAALDDASAASSASGATIIPLAGGAPAGGGSSTAAPGGSLLKKVSTATGILGRSASNKALAGCELSRVTVPMLVSECSGDVFEVAERLLERAQDLERKLHDLQLDHGQQRHQPSISATLQPGGIEGGSTSSALAITGLRGGSTLSEMGYSESGCGSRAASRRTSTTNHLSATGSAGLPPIPVAAGSNGSGGGGGGGNSSGGGALGDRHSSGGNSAESGASISVVNRSSSTTGVQEQASSGTAVAATAAAAPSCCCSVPSS